MKTMPAITVELDPADDERLKALAKQQELAPEALAQLYVRAGLAGNGETDAERRRRQGLAALQRLRELTADLPPVDAVQLVRDGREELERRTPLSWQPSSTPTLSSRFPVAIHVGREPTRCFNGGSTPVSRSTPHRYCHMKSRVP